MKVLHILTDSADPLAARAIAAHRDAEVTVVDIDLRHRTMSPDDYEALVAAIFASDRVIAWHG